jgi:hypothetical protein
MDSEGKRQGLEQVRARIEELRIEIEDLTETDKRDRLTRQSGAPWDGRTQHEARIVRINEIKEELAKLGGGKKSNHVISHIRGYVRLTVSEQGR